jgi:hypothetical protein
LEEDAAIEWPEGQGFGFLFAPFKGVMNYYYCCCGGGGINGRGKPTASVLSADGFPLMAGPNFQPSDGNPIVILILRQLADEPENVPEM